MLIIPYAEAEAETRVLNSRFIARLFPVFSQEEARKHISEVKAANPGAAHNVPAFIIGGGKNSLEYCSDDGEPAGSSGKSLLSVLKGSGLGNVLIVVTRYFGGTLLGIGGLVKAYSEAGRAVIGVTRRAELVFTDRLCFTLPYHYYDRTKLLLDEYSAFVIEENFGEEVFIKADLAKDASAYFIERLKELSGGKLAPLKEDGEPRSRLI
ncbi:YigZ family protein [Spirochaetota bacterium]